MSIKLVIVESLDLVREAIVRLLEEDEEIEVVGEAETGFEALAQVEKHQPDVVLVDLASLDYGSAMLTRLVNLGPADMEVLAFSVDGNPANNITEIPVGASKFVSNDTSASDLIMEIKLHSGAKGLSTSSKAALVAS